MQINWILHKWDNEMKKKRMYICVCWPTPLILLDRTYKVSQSVSQTQTYTHTPLCHSTCSKKKWITVLLLDLHSEDRRINKIIRDDQKNTNMLHSHSCSLSVCVSVCPSKMKNQISLKKELKSISIWCDKKRSPFSFKKRKAMCKYFSASILFVCLCVCNT